MSLDPCVTNPDFYKFVFENDRVRVLEYRDSPGDKTIPHEHPDSVMYTLSSFRRRLYRGDGARRDVEIEAGTTGWLPAQQHAGHNIGETDTRVIFVELKEWGQPDAAARAHRVAPTGTHTANRLTWSGPGLDWGVERLWCRLPRTGLRFGRGGAEHWKPDDLRARDPLDLDGLHPALTATLLQTLPGVVPNPTEPPGRLRRGVRLTGSPRSHPGESNSRGPAPSQERPTAVCVHPA